MRVSDQLGLLRTGKPPLQAAALRRAQHTTVHHRAGVHPRFDRDGQGGLEHHPPVPGGSR